MPSSLTKREGLMVPAGGALPADLKSCSRILVVRLDFIGDWVLMTPFLANLRRSAPQAEITVVVLNRVYDLARSCRFADRVVGVDAAISGPVEFCAADRETLDAFAEDYRTGAFDLALVPRWDTDFNGALRIADGSGARRVIGFSESCTAQRQTLNRGEDQFYSAVLLDRDDLHEVDHKLQFLKALGGSVGDSGLALDLDPNAVMAAREFVAQQLGHVRGFIAVAPFAVGRKQLPVERTAVLMNRLVEKLDLPVVVIGSPVHEEKADAFVKGISGDAVSAVGLPLGVSAALIGQAALLVGMDSGPAHIAAALDTPVAVIFNHPKTGRPGHVGSPERFAPWGDDTPVLIVQPETAEPPCTEGCEAEEAHCIAQLRIDDVWPAIAGFAASAVDRPAAEIVAGV